MQRIHCVLLLLQEYEHRASVLSNMLLQQDSAAGEQKELIHDLTQRLLTTACEASGLHQQGGSSRMVCCKTYHPTPVCLHTAILTARRSCYFLCTLAVPFVGWSRSDAVIVCFPRAWEMHGLGMCLLMYLLTKATTFACKTVIRLCLI